MKMDGTIELEVYCNRYSKGEIEFELSSKELKLFAESKIEASPFIYVETVGTPADGYMVYDAKTTHNRMTVSGGKSIVERIDKAVALVDISGATGDIITYVDLVLYDHNGVAISSEKLSMNVEYEQATVNIFPTKTVPVRYEIAGTPAEGYVATGNVTYETESITIMGRPATLSSVSEILVKGESVSVEGAEGTVTLNLDLDNYLPTGIFRGNRDSSNGRITVEVEVVPVIEQELKLAANQVSIINIPAKHFADRTLDTAPFYVTIRGPQHLLEQVEKNKIKGTIDIKEWMKENDITELGTGTVYKIVPKFDLGEELEVISSGTIDIVAGRIEEE
jgi:YbbR domain-containing protein